MVGALVVFGRGFWSSEPEQGAEPAGATFAPVALDSLPVVNSITFEPVSPEAGQDVKVNVGTSSLGRTLQFRYEWILNGESKAEVTGPVFPGALTNAKDALKVRVTPFDETGDKRAYASELLTIKEHDSGSNRRDGAKCDVDKECASGACGMTATGMRCIGGSPTLNKDMVLSAEAAAQLELGKSPVVKKGSAVRKTQPKAAK